MSSLECLPTTEYTSNITKLSSITPRRCKKLRKSRKKNGCSAVNNICVDTQSASDVQTLTVSKENHELKQENDKQKHEIVGLQQKIDDLNDIISCNHIDLVGKGSNLISNKIIELSRRNRHLCSDMEMYRTKCETLEREIMGLRMELKNKEKEFKDVKREVEPNEVDLLKEKLKLVTNKLLEVSNQNTSLKTELKLAMKCLKKEIGGKEPILIPNLLNNHSSGWRGRAQQILSLQTKVTELTKKLEGTDEDVSREKQRQLEFFRRCEVESLQKETQQLKATINDLQFKLTASKTRNKNLIDESASYKIKCQNLIDKQKQTEKEITELTSHISSIKLSYESQLKSLAKKIEISESKSQLCNTNVSQVLCEVHNKNDLLSQKDSEIVTLQRELEEMQRDLRQVSGDFLFNCRDLRKHQYLAILNNLEEEKCQVLDQLEKLNVRLSRERDELSNLQGLVEKQRLKICRLEGKLSKFFF